MNRNRMVAGALGLVVGAGAIGWVAGSTITSPAEAAANAAPPEASLITAAVDERVLSADIVARGSINFDDPVSLALSGAIGEQGSTAIVTMVPEVGTDLPEGGVALEVSGRPVILLQGELPVYRDLRPASKGDDVLQLEQALVRLGFMSAADEIWTAETGAGVQALYAAAGYTANATSKVDQASLDSARDGVRLANQSLQDAKKALDEAGGATGSALLEAQAAVSQAQSALTAAQATRTSAIGAANGAITVAQALVDTYPGGEPSPHTADYTELLTDVANATTNLVAVTAEHDSYVVTAQNSLTIAQARLAEAQTPGDRTYLIRAKEDAQRQLSEATKALVEIEKTVGTWMPAGELIFLKRVPVQVANAQVERGSTVSGAFMTVSGADVAMTIGIQEADAARLEVGDPVIIDEPDFLAEPLEAVISEIPEASSSGRIQMTVLLDSIPEMLMGANVRVIIPVESTAGKVLVVPAAALSAVANGDVRLEVEDADNPGTTRFVTVVTGLAADGVVEVKPVDGSLKKGDRVVVGQADIGAAGSDDEEGEAPEDAPSEESTDTEG